MDNVRADELKPGDVIAGTRVGGAYPAGPRVLQGLTPAPEHSTTREAYWLEWADGTCQVYYCDTVLMIERVVL